MENNERQYINSKGTIITVSIIAILSILLCDILYSSLIVILIITMLLENYNYKSHRNTKVLCVIKIILEILLLIVLVFKIIGITSSIKNLNKILELTKYIKSLLI